MDKEALLAKRIATEEIELDGVGTIKVRALTRAEAMQLSEKKTTVEKERFMLVAAMVDPIMDYQDVKTWQANSAAGELEHVTTAVARLSGMLDGSAKEVTARFPGKPGDAVRPLPGGEAGPDGGRDAGDDRE